MANEMSSTGLLTGRGQLTHGRKTPGGSIAVGDGLDATTFAACASINTLRAALTAANGTYYTAARMNTMNYNDLLHCWMIQQGYKTA